MASIRKEILTRVRAEDAWAALREVGALHTRLVPGFVTNTEIEGTARIVTFGMGWSSATSSTWTSAIAASFGPAWEER
jgi:hypothetical protein